AGALGAVAAGGRRGGLLAWIFGLAALVQARLAFGRILLRTGRIDRLVGHGVLLFVTPRQPAARLPGSGPFARNSRASGGLKPTRHSRTRMTVIPARLLTVALSPLLLAACSDPAPAPPAPPAAEAPTPAITAEAINAAVFALPPAAPESGAAAPSAAVARLQIMLDRAGFSPGVIDGHYGENVGLALAAFARARDLPFDGRPTPELWDALVAEAGAAPAMVAYTLTEADVAGPFSPSIPEDMAAKAELPRLAYTGPAEAIAERFHMDEDLLAALNPGVEFRAGAVVQVARPGRAPLAGPVARIVVDKAAKAVRVYDAADRLLAFYPATVG